MPNRGLILIILVSLVAGCAQGRFTNGRGDVGQFIIQQASARCGLSVSTNSLPPIAGSWRYSEDNQGVIIRMPRKNYEAVEALLRQSFGEPKYGPVDTRDGGKLAGYRLTPKGGCIQFCCDTKRTQVIVIRPLSKEEFQDSMRGAMHDERFWENLLK